MLSVFKNRKLFYDFLFSNGLYIIVIYYFKLILIISYKDEII